MIKPFSSTVKVGAEVLAHVKNSFEFTIEVPLVRAAPMFGPLGERAWAGDTWQPTFLYPQPPKDVQGAVFTIAHGGKESVWVNTVFDLHAGRMQYVVTGADIASVIDVTLTDCGDRTEVNVSYTRTALKARANVEVNSLGLKDAAGGPEWKSAIEAALKN